MLVSWCWFLENFSWVRLALNRNEQILLIGIRGLLLWSTSSSVLVNKDFLSLVGKIEMMGYIAYSEHVFALIIFWSPWTVAFEKLPAWFVYFDGFEWMIDEFFECCPWIDVYELCTLFLANFGNFIWARHTIDDLVPCFDLFDWFIELFVLIDGHMMKDFLVNIWLLF